MTPNESKPLSETELTQQARLHTMFRRRRRFWRRAITFTVVTVVIVLVVLTNRDTQRIRGERDNALMVASVLQASYDARGRKELPLSLDFKPEDAALGRRYAFNILYVIDKKSRENVGVCWLKDPVRFFVRSEGRWVVVFDKTSDRFDAVWVKEDRFREEAARLGFAHLLGNR